MIQEAIRQWRLYRALVHLSKIQKLLDRPEDLSAHRLIDLLNEQIGKADAINRPPPSAQFYVAIRLDPHSKQVLSAAGPFHTQRGAQEHVSACFNGDGIAKPLR